MVKFKLKLALFLCLLFLLIPIISRADRGMISMRADVSVYEPGQKAIVAWNGKEEVLILSTDVSAQEDTKVLELLPLPSEPSKIEKGDFQSFVEIQNLIERSGVITKTLGRGEEEKALPGIEILFYEKIGAHDITVVKVNNISDFIQWAEDFLKKQGIEHKISSTSKLENLITRYVKQKLNFFVFDLIEVSSDKKSVEPIIYQFKTSFLYYPLAITSLASGDTEVTLFILTPAITLDRVGVKKLGLTFELPYGIQVREEDQEKISFAIADLFSHIDPNYADYAELHILKHKGSTENLIGDLMLVSSSDKYGGRVITPLEEERIVTEEEKPSVEEEIVSEEKPPVEVFKEKKSTIVFWVIVGVAVGVSLIYLYLSYRRKKQQK